MDKSKFGYQENTLKAVGGEPGLERLVDCFYDLMDSAEYAQEIRAMHPADLTLARKKLTAFLTGWMGGPRRYAEKFGRINIPAAHARFVIDESHRDAWLRCMDEAMHSLRYEEELRDYLIKQLSIPAQRIVEASRAHALHEAPPGS